MNNETAEDYITFTLQYYITQNNEFVSGFPKETSNELKKQKTISRSWTPKNSGQFKICCKILNSTIQDDNSANDIACKDVFIEGNETIVNDINNTKNEDNDTLTTINNGNDEIKNDNNNISKTTITDNSLTINQINNVISNASSNIPINNSVNNSSSKNSVSNVSSNISQNTSLKSQDNEKKETSGITGKVIYESKGEKMKILSMELLLFLLIIVIIYSIIKTKLK